MGERIIQQADLFFCAGGSNKEYHAQVVGVEGGCVVRFQYGRRGSTLTSGTKTATPVTQEMAQKIYDKLVAEKTGKGYQAGSSTGVSIVSTTAGATPSVIFIPQLLNPIDESEVDQYLKDDRWGAEEKFDGRHQTIHMVKGVLKVANRKGKEIGYPKAWSQDVQVDVILDGEAIGDRFYAFDLLSLGDEDYRGRGYEERWEKLSRMGYGGSIEVVPLAIGYTAKRALYDRLKKEGREGIVFKSLDGKYCPGKNHADMFKHKFYSTASVRVAPGRSGKHSVGIEVLDGTEWVGVGNVTVGQATKLPQIGCIIEVRYLNYQEGGSLYQPTYLGIRDDIDDNECVISQLKHKAKE